MQLDFDLNLLFSEQEVIMMFLSWISYNSWFIKYWSYGSCISQFLWLPETLNQ